MKSDRGYEYLKIFKYTFYNLSLLIYYVLYKYLAYENSVQISTNIFFAFQSPTLNIISISYILLVILLKCINIEFNFKRM